LPARLAGGLVRRLARGLLRRLAGGAAGRPAVAAPTLLVVLLLAVGPEDLLLGLAVLALEVPEELVVAVGQRQVVAAAVALGVEGQGAGLGLRAPGAGGRHLDDLPLDLLAGVELERVQVEDADV